jgi:DNA-binding transcriptional regulator YiaG
LRLILFIGSIYREQISIMSEADEQATLRQSSVSPAGPRRRGRPKGQSYMEPALLVTIRHRLKLSQAILAKIVGVSRTTVSMWENGHVPIPKAAVELIKRLFPWLERQERQYSQHPAGSHAHGSS